MFCKITILVLLLCNGKEIFCTTTDVIVSDIQRDETTDTTISAEEEVNTEPFVPTNEWQVIKPGQSIPAGLHVRMNFETGIKEAKLMDNEESTNPYDKKSKTPKITIAEDENYSVPASDEKIYFTKSQLKEKLNNFRDKVGNKNVVDDITWSEEAANALNEEEKKVKSRFRSMDEIRSELEDSMGWKIKPDVEVMKESLLVLQNSSSSVDEKIAVLDNLEFYVHQIDNARDLEKIGGLEKIVKLLNDSNESIKKKAANVIGAASQSNGIVQNAVLHHGGLQLIMRLIESNHAPSTKKKAVFALSALVRGNGDAQKMFIELNGQTLLLRIIDDQDAGPLRIKCVSLLYDLIFEQQEAMIIKYKNSYKRSPLFEALINNRWCSIIAPLVTSPDYDTKEKVMQALEISADACAHFWVESDAVSLFTHALKGLVDDIQREEDADFKSYLKELGTTLENILSRVKRNVDDHGEFL